MLLLDAERSAGGVDQNGHIVLYQNHIATKFACLADCGLDILDHDIGHPVVFQIIPLQFDQTCPSFTVLAENSGNSAVTGSSGLITVTADTIASLVFNPAGAQIISAGEDLRLIIQARDTYGNPVTSSVTLNLSFSGSATATSSKSLC